MRTLRRPIVVAKIRVSTHLVQSVTTRWSSTAEMYKSYQELCTVLSNFNTHEFDCALPKAREDAKIKNLGQKYAEINSIIKELQSDSIKCSDERAIFDTVIYVYPETESRLKPDVNVVENKELEAEIVKIQNTKLSELAPEESSTVECLKLPHSSH